MIEIVAAVAIGFAVYWFTKPIEIVNGVSRFKDGERKAIFDMLAKVSPMPQTTSFPDATEFKLVQLNGASAMTVIDGARTMNLPVAANDAILGEPASTAVIVCKRGAEKNVAAPGSGFSLIVD